LRYERLSDIYFCVKFFSDVFFVASLILNPDLIDMVWWSFIPGRLF